MIHLDQVSNLVTDNKARKLSAVLSVPRIKYDSSQIYSVRLSRQRLASLCRVPQHVENKHLSPALTMQFSILATGLGRLGCQWRKTSSSNDSRLGCPIFTDICNGCVYFMYSQTEKSPFITSSFLSLLVCMKLEAF